MVFYPALDFLGQLARAAFQIVYSLDFPSKTGQIRDSSSLHAPESTGKKRTKSGGKSRQLQGSQNGFSGYGITETIDVEYERKFAPPVLSRTTLLKLKHDGRIRNYPLYGPKLPGYQKK